LTGKEQKTKKGMIMKKMWVLAIVALCATAMAVSAAQKNNGAAKRQMTPEQKQVWDEIVKKYDANGDGKLDKDEKAKISADDKKKMKDVGLIGGQKKQDATK